MPLTHLTHTNHADAKSVAFGYRTMQVANTYALAARCAP